MARTNKKPYKYKKLALALAAILILAAGYWAYGQITTYSNKRDFQQARQTIDNIYSAIQAQDSKPDNYARDLDCSRSYQELTGYGEITCNVESSFIYSVQSKDEAQARIDRIQEVINKRSEMLKPTKPIRTMIETTGVVTKNYYGVQNFYKYSSLDCTSKYVYDTPDDTFLKLKGRGKPLYVVIGCTGPAKKQYYPLNQ